MWGPVDVGVTHDDNLVVPQFGGIQGFAVLFGSNADAQGRKDVADFFVLERLVLHGFLYVQNLSSKGHDRLEFAVAALLGRTSGRITLYEEDFALGGVGFGAIRQLTG